MIHKFRTQTIKKLRKMRRRWTKEFYREIASCCTSHEKISPSWQYELLSALYERSIL